MMHNVGLSFTACSDDQRIVGKLSHHFFIRSLPEGILQSSIKNRKAKVDTFEYPSLIREEIHMKESILLSIWTSTLDKKGLFQTFILIFSNVFHLRNIHMNKTNE